MKKTNETSRRWKWGALILVFIALTSNVYADYYAIGNVGCKTNAVYTDYPGTTAVPANAVVQYIWMGPDGVINGPDPANSDKIGGDDVLLYQPASGIGYNQPGAASLPAGQFFYTLSPPPHDTVTLGINNFYARVWHNSSSGASPLSSCDRFGEVVFNFGAKFITTVGNPPPTPGNTELSSFYAVLLTEAPALPNPVSSSSQPGVGGASPQSPTVTITMSSKVGARVFEAKVYRSDADRTSETVYPGASSGGDQIKWYEPSYHQAAIQGGTADQSMSFSFPLADFGSGATVYWKVRAGSDNNGSFGWSDWVNGETPVDPNQAEFPPNPVTDLNATVNGNTITLKFTPPYYIDNLGNLGAAATMYEIRVSDEAFIDTRYPMNSTAFVRSNWNESPAIATYFPSAPIPAPVGWGGTVAPTEQQTVTITGYTGGTLFFALKSTDTQTGSRWSYISNVAGVGVGGVGGISQFVWDFIKSPSLGVNQFQFYLDPLGAQIYYSSNTAYLAGTELTKTNTKYTVIDLVNAINDYARHFTGVNANIVKAIGWWKAGDGTQPQQMEGYTISYTGETPDMAATSTAIDQTGLEPLVRNRTYQVSVGDTVTGFTIKQ